MGTTGHMVIKKPHVHLVGLAWCLISCSNPTKLLLGYFVHHSCFRLAPQEKRAHYHSTRDKIILLCDSGRPQVAVLFKTDFETLSWKNLPHSLSSPGVAHSKVHLFRSMAHDVFDQHFTSYECTKYWVDSWIA